MANTMCPRLRRVTPEPWQLPQRVSAARRRPFPPQSPQTSSRVMVSLRSVPCTASSNDRSISPKRSPPRSGWPAVNPARASGAAMRSENSSSNVAEGPEPLPTGEKSNP